MGLVSAGINDGLRSQEDAGGRSCARMHLLTDEFDVAAMFADDTLRDPKAQAGSPFALGGEEGLEESFLYILRDSRAIVGNLDGGSGLLPLP